SAESRTSFSLTPVCAERASYTSKVLAGDVGLTTEVQLTPRIGAQTNGGLAVEQTAGRGVTRTDIKTAFQNEHGLETIAQIFGAFQAPAIAFAHAIDKTSALCVDFFAQKGAVNALVTDTTIKNTV